MKAIAMKLNALNGNDDQIQQYLEQNFGYLKDLNSKFETENINKKYSKLEQGALNYGLKLYHFFLSNDEHTKELRDDIKIQKVKISALQNEVINLQQTVIMLHEELRANLQ